MLGCAPNGSVSAISTALYQKALELDLVSVHASGGDSVLIPVWVGGVVGGGHRADRLKVELQGFNLNRERTDGRGKIGSDRAAGEGG